MFTSYILAEDSATEVPCYAILGTRCFISSNNDSKSICMAARMCENSYLHKKALENKLKWTYVKTTEKQTSWHD